jgi:hypothetical protein
VEMHSSSLSTCARTPIDKERPALVCRMRAMCHTGREPRPSDSVFIRLALANVRGANMNELRDEFCAWWRCSCSHDGVLDACAQPLSDKDIEHMMKNLTADAKKFRFSTRPSARARSEKRHARRMRKRLPSGSRTTPRRCCVSFRTARPVVLQSARDIERINTDAAAGHVYIPNGQRFARSWTVSPASSTCSDRRPVKPSDGLVLRIGRVSRSFALGNEPQDESG